MNWLTPSLAVLVAVLMAIQIWWDYLLKYFFRDSRTNEHKSLRRRLLLLTLVLIVVSLFAGLNKEKRVEREKKELNTKISTLTNQIALINSNQQILQQQHGALLRELGTNSSIDLDLRRRIVDSNRKFEVVDSQVGDLNAWKANIKTRLESVRIQKAFQAEETSKAQQGVFEKCLPYYDYAVRQFPVMLEKVAAIKGDKVLSNYQSLPTVINSEVGVTNIAEIRLQTDTNWSFLIALSEKVADGRRILRISGSSGFIDMAPTFEADQFNADLHLPGEDVIFNRRPKADYKKTINDVFEDLIGASFEWFDRANK